VSRLFEAFMVMKVHVFWVSVVAAWPSEILVSYHINA